MSKNDELAKEIISHVLGVSNVRYEGLVATILDRDYPPLPLPADVGELVAEARAKVRAGTFRGTDVAALCDALEAVYSTLFTPDSRSNVALDGDTRRACNNPECIEDFGHAECCSDGTYEGQRMLLAYVRGLEAARSTCSLCNQSLTSRMRLFICRKCFDAAWLGSERREMGALGLIQQERQRQVSVEDWTAEHDSEHVNGELAKAAACYASPEPIYVHREAEVSYFVNSGDRGDRRLLPAGYYDAWPWDEQWDKRQRHDRVRQLVIAGALIVAELERLARAAGTVEAEPQQGERRKGEQR